MSHIRFPSLSHRFVVSDFTRLAAVLSGCVSVPVHGESSPFIHPSFTDVVVTPLQEGVLQALTVIEKEVGELILLYDLVDEFLMYVTHVF